MDKNILIRAYKKEDYEKAAKITMELLHPMIKGATELNFRDNYNLMLDCGLYQNEYDGYFVAEHNNEIVGVMTLTYKELKVKKMNPRLGILKIIKKYGFSKLIKLMLAMNYFSVKDIKDECYLENIVISEKARGLGIGTKLLTKAEDFTRNKKMSKLTLDVLTINDKAHALYNRFGFSDSYKKVYSKKYQKLIETEGMYRMVKEVNL